MKAYKRIIATALTACLVLSGASLNTQAAAKVKTTKVEVTKKKAKKLIIAVGTKRAVQVSVSGKKVPVTKAVFSSSKKKVATVSKKGVITAKKVGLVNIKIRYGKKTCTLPVNVVVPVKSVTLSKKKLTMTKGQKMTLKATVKPAKATIKTVAWESSNQKVASVSRKGVVTAKRIGTAVIRATSKQGKKYAVCRVVVKEVPNLVPGSTTETSDPKVTAPDGKEDTPATTPTPTPTPTPSAGDQKYDIPSGKVLEVRPEIGMQKVRLYIVNAPDYTMFNTLYTTKYWDDPYMQFPEQSGYTYISYGGKDYLIDDATDASTYGGKGYFSIGSTLDLQVLAKRIIDETSVTKLDPLEAKKVESAFSGMSIDRMRQFKSATEMVEYVNEVGNFSESVIASYNKYGSGWTEGAIKKAELIWAEMVDAWPPLWDMICYGKSDEIPSFRPSNPSDLTPGYYGLGISSYCNGTCRINGEKEVWMQIPD